MKFENVVFAPVEEVERLHEEALQPGQPRGTLNLVCCYLPDIMVRVAGDPPMTREELTRVFVNEMSADESVDWHTATDRIGGRDS